MTQSEAEEDGCDGESGDEEQSEEGHDEVEVVKGSGSRASATPILRLPERNEEDTRWTRADGTKPASAKNKLTVEDMARVCKRKELLWKEVAKNEQDSLVDRWLWSTYRKLALECQKSMRKCPGKTRKMSSVLGTRQMMDLRVRTHASRGGRSLERRVSRSVCVDFF
jgi:hypothetical protein